MRAWIATTLSALALAGCGDPQFTCESDEQCTLVTEGVCQASGHCSYPDPACPSGQRYSEHSGPQSGLCVDATGATTTTGGPDTDSADTGSGDSGSDPCLGIDCGPDGTCQPDGDQPACACEPGFVDQDLQCVEEGCPGTACLWVDAIAGDDTAPGTRKDAPIRTLARAAQLAPSLLPGEALVLHRGQSWDEPLALVGLLGTADDPVVVGAYGEGDGPLVQQGVTLDDSTGVRLQDLRITNPGATALQLQGVSHATVLGCEIFEASTGCILVRAGSEYTALVGNTAVSCGTATYGIAVTDQGSTLGDHHWLVDNRVDGEGTTSALNITLGAADDVKVVRNYLRGSVDRGLHSRVGVHGWLVGNVVAQAGDDNDAGLDHAGAGQVIARGNVLLDTTLPAVLAGRGEWAFNTVLHRSPSAAITLPTTAAGWSLHDNLVLAADAPALEVGDVGDVTADHDVYGPGMGGDCAFDIEGMLLDLAGWQALGQDTRSRCEPVPGPAIPGTIGSTLDWDAEGLLDAAVPDPAWGGCADPVGAFDCDGTPLAAGLPPFDDIGHGWEGPPQVQDRVELVP